MGHFRNMSKGQLIERLEKLEAEAKQFSGERDREAWELERRLGRILSASLNEIFLFDAETLRFVLVNSGARENLGYSMEELKALTPVDLKPEFDAARFEVLLRPLRLREQKKIEFNTLHKRKDGTTYPVAVSMEMTKWGSREVFMAVVLDVTERDRANRQFEVVVESVANGIVMANQSGEIVLVNTKVEESFGYDRSELIGKPVEVLVPKRLGMDHVKDRSAYVAHPEARSMGAGRHLYGLHKDGHEFPVEVGLSPVRTPEGLFVLAVVVDITERKQLEAKIFEISEMEKRRIGLDIHDDLCQQLAGIGCLAKVLEQKLSAESNKGAEGVAEIGRMIGQAHASAREVARGLVTGLLQSDGLDGALAELAASTEKLFGVPCRIECNQKVEMEDKRAAVQIYRIVQEAISNAVKHGEAKRIGVGLEVSDGRLRVSVTDDGIGMPAAPDQSQGLGLLTMRHRAEMLNGILRIERGESGGTVISLSMAHPVPDPERART